MAPRRQRKPMAPTNLAQNDDDELRKRGYSVGGVLGEGSYAKVGKCGRRWHNFGDTSITLGLWFVVCI